MTKRRQTTQPPNRSNVHIRALTTRITSLEASFQDLSGRVQRLEWKLAAYAFGGAIAAKVVEALTQYFATHGGL